jgi:ribosomal protein S18 acetylase RimI-like enzyme
MEETKTLKVQFSDIDRNNFEQLKQLNNLQLPVRYMSGFYARIVGKVRFGKFAYYNDYVVGAITWKYDVCQGERKIYIMTITVLDDYKRYHIGSQLLKELIRIHENTNEIKYINLHVQVSNEIALNFYLKHGFENVKLVENYYTDVDPKDAHYLRLRMH